MFGAIDFQINEARRDIDAFENKGIDTNRIKLQYLRSLTLLIVSEYENILETIFIKRATKSNDAQLTNYVKSQIERKFRSPDLGKINTILGCFDQSIKDAFMAKINNTPINSAWDNIMRARHYIVHKQGSLNLTFEELLKTYPETKKVINEVLVVLSIVENEIQ